MLAFQVPCSICEKDQQDTHFFLINIFQLNYPLHVSNRQVHHQDVISVQAACSIFHVEIILKIM